MDLNAYLSQENTLLLNEVTLLKNEDEVS
jgi:hypothetical protein